MKYYQIEHDEFMNIVENTKYRNSDVLEVLRLGYKDVLEAYTKAEHAWCRYWVIKHHGEVLTTILEARDGTLTFFNSKALKGQNMRRFVKVLKKLVDKVTKCREVVFVQVVACYKQAQTLLRLTGFTKHQIINYREIWVNEHGK